MGFPSKLKDMNLFSDGSSYLGVATEVTLPKLTMKMEEYRAGGMLGPVMIDNGLDKLELEFKLGGITSRAFRQFGSVVVDAQLNRFAGAYQDDSSGGVRAVEVVTLGRITEIDMGNAKPGEDTEHTFKVACTYFKLMVNSLIWFEIDLIAGIFIVFGNDRRAEIRAAIGA